MIFWQDVILAPSPCHGVLLLCFHHKYLDGLWLFNLKCGCTVISRRGGGGRFTSNHLLTCHWDFCELRPPTLCWILLQKSPVSAHPGQSRRNSPSMAERKDPHNQGKGSRWSCDLYCTRLWDPPEMFPYVCENISSSLYKLHVRSCGEVELVDLACSVKSLVTKISSVGG